MTVQTVLCEPIGAKWGLAGSSGEKTTIKIKTKTKTLKKTKAKTKTRTNTKIRWLEAEMEKRADNADISVLFFL